MGECYTVILLKGCYIDVNRAELELWYLRGKYSNYHPHIILVYHILTLIVYLFIVVFGVKNQVSMDVLLV